MSQYSESEDTELDAEDDGEEISQVFESQSGQEKQAILRLCRLSQSSSDSSLTDLRSLLRTLPPSHLELVDRHGRTPLLAATVVNNNDDAVRLLLAAGASPQACDPADGLAALHKAVVDSSASTARLLLAAEADVDARVQCGGDSRTPLMLAAAQDDEKLVRLLLANGAALSARSERGWTAKEIAEMRHSRRAVRLLNEWESMEAREKQKILKEEEGLKSRAEDQLRTEQEKLQPSMETDAIATSVRHLRREKEYTKPKDSDRRTTRRPTTARRRGRCLVINVNLYDSDSGFAKRSGSEHDVRAVETVFKKLRFLVTVEEDLTGAEIARCVTEFAWRCHKNYDIFVCFLMAHGAAGVIFGRDGTPQSISELAAPFKANNCASLRRKPKIFFVQACRHTQPQAAGVVASDSEPNRSNADFCPAAADFLFCYANAEDLPAFRSPEKGSVFVQALCSLLLERHHTDHLLDILTAVNQRMQDNPVRDAAGRLLHVPVLEVVTRLADRVWMHPDFA